MSIKPDVWIRDKAIHEGMIDPFCERLVQKVQTEGRILNPVNPVISYGLSSFGYDLRVADEYDIFVPNYQDGSIVDPKRMSSTLLRRVAGQGYCIIPPNSFALARSVEYLRIPRNVFCICVGKSTYARVGLVVNVTPFEPEWEGQVTLELSNTTPLPMKVYSNEGICQILFFESDEECEVSYADRNGKYQRQTGITPSRV